MRTGSDIVIRPSRTPGIVVAICWAKRPRSSGDAAVEPMMPMIMKGAASKPVFSSPSARMSVGPGGAGGIGLEGAGDFAIGLGGQVRHQHLDALVLGLEPDE